VVDNVRIPRLQTERRHAGPGASGGRVEHDSRGTAIWVRTRATDAQEPIGALDLSIEGMPAERIAGRMVKKSGPYYEYSGPAEAPDSRRRSTDLHALSRWISAKKRAAENSDD
jgi:hypothetical protein